MQDHTTVCGTRIDYEYADCVPEMNADVHQSAVKHVEDVLAVIEEIQDGRTNEEGDVCEPLTRSQINTIRELNKEYLNPALAVLTALEGEK